MVGFYPTHDRTYIFNYLPWGKMEELKGRGLATFKDELARIVPEAADSLEIIRSWDDTLYATPKKIVVDNWVANRAALLGDAAHALNPAWAQGANMTLQDTLVLADTVEKCFRSDDFSTEALRTV